MNVHRRQSRCWDYLLKFCSCSSLEDICMWLFVKKNFPFEILNILHILSSLPLRSHQRKSFVYQINLHWTLPWILLRQWKTFWPKACNRPRPAIFQWAGWGFQGLAMLRRSSTCFCNSICKIKAGTLLSSFFSALPSSRSRLCCPVLPTYSKYANL